jgi:hypothetical protein
LQFSDIVHVHPIRVAAPEIIGAEILSFVLRAFKVLMCHERKQQASNRIADSKPREKMFFQLL